MSKYVNENDYIKFFFRLFLIILLTYGFLYSGYKLWTPESTGGNDFYEYYKMFLDPLNNSAAAPFVYRQFSAWIVYFIDLTNLNYDTLISFNNPLISQSTFLAAIISSYIALVLTSLIITYSIDIVFGKTFTFVPIVAGLIVFFSFNTIPHNISGIFEAWSWFFYALIFFLYLKKSKFIFLFLLLSITQRELIPVVFGVMSFISISFEIKKNNFNLFKSFDFKILIISMFSFLIYILVRTQFFPIPGNENQLLLTSILLNLTNFRPNLSFLIPVFFSQNILFLYLISFGLKRWNKDNFKQLSKVLSVYLVLAVMGIGTGIGDNLGRILSQFNPILIIMMFDNFYNYYKSTSRETLIYEL